MANEERIAALEAAIATGERRVRFEGREVEYRSVEEMLRAIAFLRGHGAVITPRWRLTPTMVDRNR